MDIANIEQLAVEADDAIATLDASAARAVLKQLISLGVAPEQGDEAGVLYRDLLFVRLPQLSSEQSTWLFQHCILAGLAIPEFDLLSRITDALSVVFDEDERIQLAEKLVNAIAAGTELLGPTPLTIEKQQLPQTVQNWIKDYLLWPAPSQERKGLDELNYANKSDNAKKLDQNTRTTLIALLGVYDTLRNSVVAYKNLPVIYVEDHPNADLTALSASPDEFDSEQQASDEYIKAAKSLGQSSTTTIPTSAPLPRTTFVPEPIESAPNIQGVLVQTPLGVSDNSGLDMAPPHVAASVSKPASAVPKVEKPRIPDLVTTKKDMRDVPRPAAVPAQKQVPKLQSTQSRPPVIPLASQPVAKQGSPIKLAKPVPSMDELKHEAEARRDSVQADIDSKLSSLKKKTGE